MNYYILKQDPRIIEQPSLLRCPDDLNPENLINGEKISISLPIRLTLSPRSSKFRGAIIGGILTLFHNILRDELIRLGIDNIQYFPVELENPEGGIEHNYSLINIIGMIEAVDVSASVIKPRATGGRGQLYSFKIDPEVAGERRLFRIIEAPTLIIINENLWKDLSAFKPSGVMMLPTERYDGWG